ncbi:MAG: hypothetical protein ACYC6S_05840 [Desulfobulbia bacterium]
MVHKPDTLSQIQNIAAPRNEDIPQLKLPCCIGYADLVHELEKCLNQQGFAAPLTNFQRRGNIHPILQPGELEAALRFQVSLKGRDDIF